MGNRTSFWRLAHALSLDIVAGCVCGGMLAVHTTGAAMPAAWWWILPAAVWVVYTTDHLMDAARVGPSAAAYRHRLHARHAVPLASAAILAGLFGLAGASSRLPADLLQAGGILAGAVAVYLLACQFYFGGRRLKRFPKEPAAAILYTVGIWFGPMIRANRLAFWEWMAAALFGLGALLNLLTGSVLGLRDDRREGHVSIAARWNTGAVIRGTLLLSAAGLSAAGTGAWLGPVRLRGTFLVVGLLSAGPAFGLVRRMTTGDDGGFQAWGDLLFLLQAVPYLWTRWG